MKSLLNKINDNVFITNPPYLIKKIGGLLVLWGNTFPLLLFILCLLIIFGNYIPNTYLSGWDTLHPEFNFSLNFQRLLFGVFRTEQGLGAVAAHSHMSDLPRVIILAVVSLFAPNNLLRFLYIVACLPVGVLGTYFFIKSALLSDQPRSIKIPLSFLGAAFYLLNLGTLQQFVVPFEMFTVQYAFLPWLFLTAFRYIKNPTRKNLLFFSLITLLSTPMAYAATLWYAYFLAFSLFLVSFGKKHFRQSSILIIFTLIINSFWLLPNIYFVLSGNANQVPEARINKIFSEEAFAYNKSYGDFLNTIIFKNFYFDWPVYNPNSQHFETLLTNWNNYLTPQILRIGYLNAGIVFLGFIYLLITKKPISKAIIAPTLLVLVLLLNLTPPFDIIFSSLRDHSALLKEALRFPFTKFSIILIFGFSCFYSLGHSFILSLINKIKLLPKRTFLIPQLVIFTALLIIYMLPAFQGNFISKYMFVKIPDNYFQMFNYLDAQPSDERVAILPMNSFWGWIYYKWGFQGAQFVSFGIKQPLLDRDYDRWNPTNEEYYRQMSYALYSQNLPLVESILEKYRVGFLVIDESIISPDMPDNQKSLFIDETKSLFESSNGKITLAQKFGDISIYNVKLNEQSQDFISSSPKYSIASYPDGPKDTDWAYFSDGDYIQASNTNLIQDPTILYYPFASLSDNQNILNNLISANSSGLSLDPSFLPRKATLSLDEYSSKEASVPANLYTRYNNSNLEIKIIPDISQGTNSSGLSYKISIPNNIDNQDIFLSLDRYQSIKLKDIKNSNFVLQGKIYLSTKSSNNLNFYYLDKNFPLDPSLYSQNPELCGNPELNQFFGSKVSNVPGIELFSKNAVTCAKIPFKQIFNFGNSDSINKFIQLQFSVHSNNQNFGHYCVYDNLLRRCIKEEKYISTPNIYKDYLLISPADLDRLDLIFYLDNINHQTLSSILYSNVNFSQGEEFNQLVIFPSEIQNFLQGQTLSINPENKFFISLSDDKNIPDFNILDENHSKDFCGNTLPTFYDRQINQKFGYVEYDSINGSSCDYYSLNVLPHNLGYLLLVENQNVTGLPLRICISNPFTDRCDLYLTLPYNKDFKQNFIMIPPTNDGGIGYDFHIDNYSVGKIPTTNRIKQIKIYPFPYNWITQMKLTSTPNYIHTSDVKIKSLSTLYPNFYFINYKNEQSTPSLLTLNQSFEKGWITLDGHHVKVNNWSNGWLIPGNAKGLTVILYLPQFLELLSFAVLAAVFSYLINLRLNFREIKNFNFRQNYKKFGLIYRVFRKDTELS